MDIDSNKIFNKIKKFVCRIREITCTGCKRSWNKRSRETPQPNSNNEEEEST